MSRGRWWRPGSVVELVAWDVEPRQFFVRFVRVDIDQRCNVTDVSELGSLAAAVERGDRQLDPAALNLGSKRPLVEVSEVLHAQLFKGYQHVAERAVKQLDGGRVGCWHQAQRVLIRVIHGSGFAILCRFFG